MHDGVNRMPKANAQYIGLHCVVHGAGAPGTVAHQQQRMAGDPMRQIQVVPDHHHGLALLAAQVRQQAQIAFEDAERKRA